MKTRRIALLAIGILSAAGTAQARLWQSSPVDKAMDYLQIIDRRSAREIVFVFWMSPDIIDNTPRYTLPRELLASSLVFGVAHADVGTSGEMKFREIPPPTVETRQGERKPLGEDELKPGGVALLAGMKASFAQALGEMGQGVRWFVFSTSSIDSCKEGIFWLVHGGVRYEYRTPVPGCVR